MSAPCRATRKLPQKDIQIKSKTKKEWKDKKLTGSAVKTYWVVCIQSARSCFFCSGCSALKNASAHQTSDPPTEHHCCLCRHSKSERGHHGLGRLSAFIHEDSLENTRSSTGAPSAWKKQLVHNSTTFHQNRGWERKFRRVTQCCPLVEGSVKKNRNFKTQHNRRVNGNSFS